MCTALAVKLSKIILLTWWYVVWEVGSDLDGSAVEAARLQVTWRSSSYEEGSPLSPLSLYWSDWIDQITSTPIDRSLVMRTFKTRPLQTVKYTLLILRIDRSVSDTSRGFSRSVSLVPPADKDRWKTIINRVTRQPLVCCIVDYLITNSSRAFNSP